MHRPAMHRPFAGATAHRPERPHRPSQPEPVPMLRWIRPYSKTCSIRFGSLSTTFALSLHRVYNQTQRTRTQKPQGGFHMVPLDGPHKKKTEGARTKAAPLATALSSKRVTKSRAQKPPKPVVISDGDVKPVNDTVVPEESVRISAYLKWEAAGRPEGDGLIFWLEAEREMLADL